MDLITVLFKDQDSAETVYRKANEMDYANNEINIVIFKNQLGWIKMIKRKLCTLKPSIMHSERGIV